MADKNVIFGIIIFAAVVKSQGQDSDAFCWDIRCQSTTNVDENRCYLHSEGIEEISLVERESKCWCREDNDYGVRENYIWVKNGCRGLFHVCVPEMPAPAVKFNTSQLKVAARRKLRKEFSFAENAEISLSVQPENHRNKNRTYTNEIQVESCIWMQCPGGPGSACWPPAEHKHRIIDIVVYFGIEEPVCKYWYSMEAVHLDTYCGGLFKVCTVEGDIKNDDYNDEEDDDHGNDGGSMLLRGSFHGIPAEPETTTLATAPPSTKESPVELIAKRTTAAPHWRVRTTRTPPIVNRITKPPSGLRVNRFPPTKSLDDRKVSADRKISSTPAVPTTTQVSSTTDITGNNSFDKPTPPNSPEAESDTVLIAVIAAVAVLVAITTAIVVVILRKRRRDPGLVEEQSS